MYVSKIKTPYRTYRKARICQGDIFKDIVVSIGRRDGAHDEFSLLYGVVVTQDCDLEQDYNDRKNKKTSDDKKLDVILICPAYPIDSFSSGSHLEGKIMETFNSGKRKKLVKNEEYKRYHYLEQDLDYGVPSLIIDFKHFLTVPRSILYKQRKDDYITSVNEIYREYLSQRFVNYLGRIGLPGIVSK